MIARAPGKIVLSGAYAVLEGAPAIVASVDRYVVADAARPATLVTDEVREAIAAGALERAPWFDASALRAAPSLDGVGRKLGLGSSAAILVASLAAVFADRGESARDLVPRLFMTALAAHRAAQAGGSGVDVAASVHGGVLLCSLGPARELDVRPHVLPEGTVVEVFASTSAASTRGMLEKVAAYSRSEPAAWRDAIGRAGDAARRAVDAGSPEMFVREIGHQIDALGELGRQAGAPIVTADVDALRPIAMAEGAAFGPAGAGGGDVSIYVGAAPSSPSFVARARALGLEPLTLKLGVQGVYWGAA